MPRAGAAVNLTLDALDLAPTPPAAPPGLPGPAPATGLPADEPVYAGDRLAALYDSGVSYDSIMEWLRMAAFHARPRRGNLADVFGFGPEPTDPEVPLATAVAMLACADESERDHLVRAGHQVPLFDLPYLDRLSRRHALPHLRLRLNVLGPRHGAVPSIASQRVLATFPTLPERMLLADRAGLSRAVLELLATDPNPVLRSLVVRHRKTDAALTASIAAEESNDEVLWSLMISRHVDYDTVRELLSRSSTSAASLPTWVHEGMRRHPDSRVAALLV